MKKLFLIVVIGLIGSMTATANDYLSQIKKQLTEAVISNDPSLEKELTAYPQEEYIGDQVVVELYENYPLSKSGMETLLGNMNADGSWKDLGYVNIFGDPGSVDIQHVQRLLALCIAFRNPSSPYYNNVRVKNAISKALTNWLSRNYVLMEHTKRGVLKTNFWYNDIGIPRMLGQACIMFEDEMTSEQHAAAINALRHVRIYGQGQNKIWLAGNVLMRGLLEGNAEEVRAARDTIVNEVTYDKHAEGIMSDYSYHMHGPEQQFGNYGAIFIGDMAFWSLTLRDTPLAFSQDKLDIIADFAYNGLGRVLWNGLLDVNGLGRQVFRYAQRHKGLYMNESFYRLSLADKKNRNRYQSIIDSNFGGKLIQTGLYHFYKSDQTVCRRPSWMMSVRMSSKRAMGGEASFSDNLQGYYMSDGSCYTYIDGDEYENTQPYQDWHHIPGVTAYDTPTPLKRLNYAGYKSQSYYVGHVGDGHIGLTTMNLVRDKLDALKSWIFTDDYVVCLGAGIKTPQDSDVITSIDQLRHLSDLQHLTKGRWTSITDYSIVNPKDERFFHGKTGYIAMSGENLIAKDEERSGSWHDIMTVYPKEMIVKNKLVSLWFDHGKKPQNGSYAYIILPASSKEKVAKFNLKDVEIIRNDRSIQAVHLPKYKVVFVSVFQPTNIKLPYGIPFQAKDSGLYMIDYSKSRTNPNIKYDNPLQQK